MKLASILAISAVYWVIVGFAFFYVSFQCDMGPDSPVACNAAADRNASLLIVIAASFYVISRILLWRKKRTGN